ncbi:MAG TPA: hypothetical protein VF549_16650 [Solirubrobacteraceae bacterium]
MHAEDVPPPLMHTRALVLLAVAALSAAAVSCAGGPGGEASARTGAPELFAAYVIAGAPEPVEGAPRDGVATLAPLAGVAGVAVRGDGSVLVAERGAHRVVRIDPDGRLAPFAGTGTPGFSGDGGPAAAARLRAPSAVTVLPGGDVLVADSGNHRVRRVAANGSIRTVAGCGRGRFSGDGRPAVRACLRDPRGLAALAPSPDAFLVADTGNDRIRRVSDDGRITTVAGSGRRGFGGDGGPARRARLAAPAGVAARPGGGFVVADAGNHRIRSVSSFGAIRTLAGGRDASRARIGRPVALASARDGAILVADAGATRRGIAAGLRRVSRRGVVTSLIGADGAVRMLGSIGRARPAGVAVARDGSVVVSDAAADRVLLLAARRATRFAARLGPAQLVLQEGDPLNLTLLATDAADVALRVARDGATVREERLALDAGATTRRFLDRVEPGSYRVELLGRHGDRVTTDALDVQVGGPTRLGEPATG